MLQFLLTCDKNRIFDIFFILCWTEVPRLVETHLWLVKPEHVLAIWLLSSSHERQQVSSCISSTGWCTRPYCSMMTTTLYTQFVPTELVVPLHHLGPWLYTDLFFVISSSLEASTNLLLSVSLNCKIEDQVLIKQKGVRQLSIKRYNS